jgi:hypothetical protein
LINPSKTPGNPFVETANRNQPKGTQSSIRYKGAFGDQGWNDGSSPATPEPNMPTMLVFLKDKTVFTIQINAAGGKTMIMINEMTQ